jgi:hypothetical protein
VPNTVQLIPALSAHLTAPLTASATALPLDPGVLAHIYSWLGTTRDTYLLVHSPGGAELVMAWMTTPSVLSVLRGQGGTYAMAHPTGACVATAANAQCAIERIVAENTTVGVTPAALTAAVNAAVALALAALTSAATVPLLANDGAGLGTVYAALPGGTLLLTNDGATLGYAYPAPSTTTPSATAVTLIANDGSVIGYIAL